MIDPARRNHRASRRHGDHLKRRSPGLRPIALLAMLAVIGAAPAQRAPTTQTSIGLFYLPDAPETADLWRDGDEGERLYLQGRVLDPRGAPLADARVELWHADAAGSVDETRYRATRRSDATGRFAIKTVLPGHIPMARYNATFGPRHIHIRVSHPAHPPLVSLIFFKNDGRLAGTPYPELAIPLEISRTPAGEVRVGSVEIVLGAPPLPAGGEWISD
jgi:catechol 1,2-dioxygenase